VWDFPRIFLLWSQSGGIPEPGPEVPLDLNTLWQTHSHKVGQIHSTIDNCFKLKFILQARSCYVTFFFFKRFTHVFLYEDVR
jgi:hypothetical protein